MKKFSKEKTKNRSGLFISGVAMTILVISGQSIANESTTTSFVEACKMIGGNYGNGKCIAKTAMGDTLFRENRSYDHDRLMEYLKNSPAQKKKDKEKAKALKQEALAKQKAKEKPKFISICSTLSGNLNKDQSQCAVKYFTAHNLQDLEIYSNNIDEWKEQLKAFGYKHEREYVVCNLIGWGNATYRCGTDSGIPELAYNKKHEPITRIGATVAASYYDKNIAATKEKNDALAKEQATAEAEAKKAQLTKMWNSRKGNTNPLEFGKSYKCTLVPGGVQSALSSVYGSLLDGAFSIDLGRKSMNFGDKSYMAIEEYNDFYLYQRYDETIKVLKKDEIGQGYTNLIKDNISYYCE